MPKTTFVPNQILTAAQMNAIANPVFDDLDLDGHNPRLADDSLSNTPGNIKPQWQAFRDALLVSSAGGLAVSYAGGSITQANGVVLQIAPGTLGLQNNATQFVFVNELGAVATGLNLPVRGIPLARITTAAGTISGSIEDLRPKLTILPQAQAIKVFGGSGSQGAYSLNFGSTDTLSGEYFFTDFTVAVGATLTIRGAATIYCSGNVTISGTIIILPPIKGGQGYRSPNLSGILPNAPGFGLGGGNSVNAAASDTYSFLASPLGSGGAGGWVELPATTISLITPRGGNGGGNIIFEAAGTITITGTTTAIGESGQGHTSVTNFTGGAVTGFSGSLSGGGGGSGGLIWLRSLRSINASAGAVLSVAGGNGGTGYPNNTTQQTAGGGGGGYVVCTAPVVNLTGATINLSGGTSAIASSAVFGSVSGGSFAGAGGAPGQSGQIGQLITRNVIPV